MKLSSSSLLVVLLVGLSCTVQSQFVATTFRNLTVLPWAQTFSPLVGMYAVGDALNSIERSTGDSFLVASAQYLRGLLTWQQTIYYQRSLGFFGYQWPAGLFIIEGIISDLSPNTLVSATHGIYYLQTPLFQSYILWKSDGTSQGTNPVTGAQCPTAMVNLTVQNDNVVILSYGELDYYNPSVGCVALGQHCNGPVCIVPTDLYYFGNYMYFRSKNQNGVYAIWISNFTAAGTSELCASAVCLSPTHFLGLGKSLGFFTITGTTSQLYSLNETGVEQLITTFVQKVPTNLASFWVTYNSVTYFLMSGSPLTNCIEIWASTGTTSSTVVHVAHCVDSGSTFQGSYIKAFPFTISGTTYMALSFQGVISSANASGMALSYEYFIYSSQSQTVTSMGPFCSNCTAVPWDLTYVDVTDAIWMFSTSGLKKIPFPGVTFSSEGFLLSPSILFFLLAILMTIMSFLL